MTTVLSQYAANVRDIAILVAAALALLSFVLSLPGRNPSAQPVAARQREERPEGGSSLSRR